MLGLYTRMTCIQQGLVYNQDIRQSSPAKQEKFEHSWDPFECGERWSECDGKGK